MKKIKLVVVFLLISVVLFMTGCSKSQDDVWEDLLGIDYSSEGHEVSLEKYQTENPVVAMDIQNYGSIVIELYPEKAPNTVNNFLSLVKDGFYDHNTFHRLVPGFVLQGGDPDGKGTGGPGYTIKGEFRENGIDNDLLHDKWVVSMARSNSYDSAGSQFFIMLEKTSYLDGNYAAFGKVIDGKKAIEKIVENEKIADQQTGQLQKNLIIKKAIVDQKGKTYPEVEKIEEDS